MNKLVFLIISFIVFWSGLFSTKGIATEIITSKYQPKCDFAGAKGSEKDLYKFLIKFKFPHSGSLAKGEWEQIFQGWCDFKKHRDEIYIVTLSAPVDYINFDVTTLETPDFKCQKKGGFVNMSWGIHALNINISEKNAIYTTEEGVNVKTSCK